MRITLLGTGGPRPDPNRQGPATLVSVGGLHLLFDAGRGVASQLAKVGVTPDQLDAVFITHHHFDHIGGLGDLLMAGWLTGRDRPLLLRGPVGLTEIVDSLFTTVYWRDIDYRLAEEHYLGNAINHPRSMIDVADVDRGQASLSPDVTVKWDRVEHGSTALGLSDTQWTALGFRVEGDGRIAAISGDAVPCAELIGLTEDADALVMCAYLAADEIVSPDDDFLVEKIIAGAPQATAIALEANVSHLVLTHIRAKADEAVKRMANQVVEAFPGQVTVGHDLLEIDV